MRTFGGAARDIWKKNDRIQHICSIIVRAALNPKANQIFGKFEIFDNYRVALMTLRKEFGLTVIDKATNTHGFIVQTHKKMCKEAVYRAMEDMRYLCRARNVETMYAFATNLYDWQIVHYSKRKELDGEEDFFQLSQVFKLYVYENNY